MAASYWLKVKDGGGTVRYWKLTSASGGFNVKLTTVQTGLKFPVGSPVPNDTVHNPDGNPSVPVTIEHMQSDGTLPTAAQVFIRGRKRRPSGD